MERGGRVTIRILGVAVSGDGIQVVGAVLQVGRPLQEKRCHCSAFTLYAPPPVNTGVYVVVRAWLNEARVRERLTVQSRTAFSAGL